MENNKSIQVINRPKNTSKPKSKNSRGDVVISGTNSCAHTKTYSSINKVKKDVPKLKKIGPDD